MADIRARVRRILEALALLGAALACAIGSHFAKVVADATPIASGGLELKAVPILTAQVLAWKDRLPTIGMIIVGIIAVAAVLTFSLSRNEDTRLQATLVIAIAGYAAALQMWVTVGIALVVLPHHVQGI